ncbi:MAG: TMEM175 family protein [Acidimicrobiales bacterium]
MNRGRLEAFSDAVIAIVMTIMVLSLHPPHDASWAALKPIVPDLLVYLLSFVNLAIYWNNHHHLLQVVERIDGGVLWANMGLLFWLSLIPVATAWLGPHTDDAVPAFTYALVLLGAAIAYFVLTRALLRLHAADSRLATALGRDTKGKLSLVAYIAAMASSATSSWADIALCTAVAVMWLIPDRRIERVAAALPPKEA